MSGNIIAHSDSTALPLFVNTLERSPGITPKVFHRPVDEIEVHIVQSKLSPAFLEGLESVLVPMIRVPELRGHEDVINHAHNLYLQIGIDVGLPGLIAYLVLLAMLLYGLIRAYRLVGQGRADVRMLAAACLTSLAGMGIHGLIDVATWGNKAAFLPWVVMGLGAGIERFVRRDMSGQNTEPDSGAAPRTG